MYNVCTDRTPPVQKPRTTVIGENVTLPCRTTLKTPVNWYYSPSEKTDDFNDDWLICKAGNILNRYSRRMTLDKRVHGDFSLVILNVTREDQGVYICLEDKGRGLKHQIKLTVEGKSLSKFF